MPTPKSRLRVSILGTALASTFVGLIGGLGEALADRDAQSAIVVGLNVAQTIFSLWIGAKALALSTTAPCTFTRVSSEDQKAQESSLSD